MKERKPAVTNKVKIVMSDLHLGAGLAEQGNRLEDFTSHEPFAAFLGQLVEESEETGTEMELILNGDCIEFLQVPAVTSYDPQRHYNPDAYRSSSEEAAVQRTSLVTTGHSSLFGALRDFLKPASPRRYVTILKGNHDVQLYWPAVKKALRQALGATGERAELLTFHERCISREGIYVEHGNQYAETGNRFQDFEEPLDPEDRSRLETPWGSRFMVEFFNEVEQERYWVDNVKPVQSLLWYSLAYDFPFACRAILAFLKALPRIIGLVPLTDEQVQTVESLIEELEDEGQRTALWRDYAEDAAFRRDFQIRLQQAMALALPQAEEVPRPTWNLAGQLLPQEIARQIIREQDEALRKIADTIGREEGVEVVIFGHTHRPMQAAISSGVYINTGTWTWQVDYANKSDEEWRELFEHPERFADERTLSYARIEYDEEGHARAQLLEYPSEPSVAVPPLLSWWQRIWLFLRRLFLGD
ncbi:MAG: hypothetical protein ACE5NP_05925 [Anaerolineae bacterium]